MTGYGIRFALISCVLLITSEGLNVKLKPPGETIVKPQGRSMVFTCLVDEDSFEDNPSDNRTMTEKFRFQWLDQTEKDLADTAGRRYVEEAGEDFKLFIGDIEQSDAGAYTCKVTNRAVPSQTASKTVRLELFEPITFSNCEKEQFPAIYTDALISCVVNGKPTPEVSWKYKGKKLRLDGRYNKTSKGLLIRNVTRADDGPYACRAEVEDEGRLDERIIQVSVHIPPTMTMKLEKTESVEGQSVTLKCKADGLPEPTYKFFKDGVELVSDTAGRVTLDGNAGRLTIKPVNRTDKGNYECRASNDVGRDSSKAYLNVSIPAAIDRFLNETLPEERKLSLTCQSTGDPAPTVVITRAGLNYTINNKTNQQGYQLTSSKAGELVLSVERVRVEDAGEYTCTAFNKVGQQSLKATVTVNFKPRFSKDNDIEVYSWAGATHNLTCQVFGLPVPTVAWRRGQLAIQANDTFRIFESRDGNSTRSSLQVTVTKAELAWVLGKGYICEATNDLGIGRQEFELKRAMTPDMPKGIKVIERQADSLIIEVEEPRQNGGVPVTGYSVSYTEKKANVVKNPGKQNGTDASAGNRIKTDKNSRMQGTEPDDSEDSSRPLTKGNEVKFEGNRTRINNLKSETPYTLAVKARNQVGPGPEHTEVITTDKQSEPKKIIINSAQHSTEGRRYELKWEVHNTGGLPIEEYQFSYTKVQRQGGSNEIIKPEGWKTINEPAKANTYVYLLKDLDPQSTYIVQMKAKNKLGWSPQTDRFTFTTVEAQESSAVLTQAHTGGIAVGLFFLLLLPVLLVVDIWRHNSGQSSFTGFVLCCVRGTKRTEKQKKNDESKSDDDDVEKQTSNNHHSEENGKQNNTSQPKTVNFNDVVKS